MTPKKITFTSGKNKLVGNLFVPSKNHKQIGLLILNGGGTSSKERYTKLQKHWYKKGYTSFAFDFQGSGESEGVFEQGSLLRRREDAQAAYHEFKKHVPNIIVVGFSMGGHIAARFSEAEDVFSLILFCPAAYAKEAEDKLLNKEFTKVLRTPNSWKNSPAFSAIKKFSGKTLVIYGEYEVVIPKDIQKIYREVIENKGKFVIVPNGTHALLAPQTSVQKRAKKQAYSEIDSFLEELNHKQFGI